MSLRRRYFFVSFLLSSSFYPRLITYASEIGYPCFSPPPFRIPSHIFTLHAPISFLITSVHFFFGIHANSFPLHLSRLSYSTISSRYSFSQYVPKPSQTIPSRFPVNIRYSHTIVFVPNFIRLDNAISAAFIFYFLCMI